MVKTTMGHIRARLAENYTSDDLILVTDYITAKWLNDSRMSDYLRPKTLFSPETAWSTLKKLRNGMRLVALSVLTANGKPGESAVYRSCSVTMLHGSLVLG